MLKLDVRRRTIQPAQGPCASPGAMPVHSAWLMLSQSPLPQEETYTPVSGGHPYPAAQVMGPATGAGHRHQLVQCALPLLCPLQRPEQMHPSCVPRKKITSTAGSNSNLGLSPQYCYCYSCIAMTVRTHATPAKDACWTRVCEIVIQQFKALGGRADRTAALHDNG